MIRLFNRNETQFDHNECILTDVISCKVTEESNKGYECILTYPKNELAKQLTEGKILKVPVHGKEDQLFRIYKPVKNLKTYTIYARHIFYDLLKNFLEDVRPTNAVGIEAINTILNGTQYEHRFKGTSDISTIGTAYYVRKNPVAALMGSDDNSFINNWGGEINRDNFSFSINQNGGTDRGYEIRVGKNLTDIEADVDTSDVVTRIMPTVVIDNEVVTKLPEKYVSSPLINNYECPYINEVRIDLTDEQKALNIEEIYTYMRDYCNKLFKSGVDKPKLNFKINFVELSRTEQYKDLGILEKINLYDTVTTKISDLDIDVKAKVIKTTYDALKGKFESIEIGSFRTSLASQNLSTQYKITKKIETTKNAYQEAITDATQKITGNLGGYKIDRLNAEGKPYETLYMDTDNINTAKKMLRINQEGIGGSTDGYNPDNFKVAITTDGTVCADRIIGETVEGLVVKGAVIKTYDKDGNTTFYADENGEVTVNAKSISLNSYNVATKEDLEDVTANLVSISSNSPVFKMESGATTYSPSQVLLTPTFQNCHFVKWQYSIDNSTTWIDIVSGQHNLYINSTTRVLTINNDCDLYSSIKNVSFKIVTDVTEAYDIMSIPVLTDGEEGYTIILTNESHVFPCDVNRDVEIATSTTTSILAYKGTTEVTPVIGTLPTVSGLTITKSGTTITISTVAGSSLATEGTFDIPITVDGKSFTKKFSWVKSNATMNNIIASINLSGEIAKIHASKIQLEGAVTVDGTFGVNDDGKIYITGGTLAGMKLTGSGIFANNVDNNNPIGFGLCSNMSNAGIAMYVGADENNMGGAPTRIYHSGKIVCNDFESNSANITGGNINITSGSESVNQISLNYNNTTDESSFYRGLYTGTFNPLKLEYRHVSDGSGIYFSEVTTNGVTSNCLYSNNTTYAEINALYNSAELVLSATAPGNSTNTGLTIVADMGTGSIIYNSTNDANHHFTGGNVYVDNDFCYLTAIRSDSGSRYLTLNQYIQAVVLDMKDAGTI